MLLPNFEKAYIDKRKLANYALDPNSPRGRHKARVFKSALGIEKADEMLLQSAILREIRMREATKGEQDLYGQRYAVDCRIGTDVGDAIVRTSWIIRRDEDFPRLTSCYVLKKGID